MGAGAARASKRVIAGSAVQRRVVERLLRHLHGPMDDARADDPAILQLGGDPLQKSLTVLGVNRRSGGEHGVEFLVGQLDHRAAG
jgi:hypothetical protein